MKENIDDLEADPLESNQNSGLHKSSIFFISGISLALITIIIKLVGPRDFLGIKNKAGYYGAIFFIGILVAILLISIAIYISGALKTEKDIEEPTDSEVEAMEKKESIDEQFDQRSR